EPRCQVCGTQLRSEFSMPVCAECAKGRSFERCFVPFRYADGINRAISRMKFSGSPARFRYFAREIFIEMGDFRPDFITFVPQNRKTLLKRGYNHTELIAEELGRLMKIPVKDTLVRRKGGRRQLGLTRAQRRENAKTLFLPGKKSLSGICLIVDDVMTTGSTMDACCHLLRKMGCEKVYAAAAARRVLM
ncbi:MAG: ComF family protein, partial [Clostridia bacterium]